MSGRNPIDSLQLLSPVSDADAASVFGVTSREELLAGVVGLPFGRARAQKRAPRRRLALSGSGAREPVDEGHAVR